MDVSEGGKVAKNQATKHETAPTSRAPKAVRTYRSRHNLRGNNSHDKYWKGTFDKQTRSESHENPELPIRQTRSGKSFGSETPVKRPAGRPPRTTSNRQDSQLSLEESFNNTQTPAKRSIGRPRKLASKKTESSSTLKGTLTDLFDNRDSGLTSEQDLLKLQDVQGSPILMETQYANDSDFNNSDPISDLERDYFRNSQRTPTKNAPNANKSNPLPTKGDPNDVDLDSFSDSNSDWDSRSSLATQAKPSQKLEDEAPSIEHRALTPNLLVGRVSELPPTKSESDVKKVFKNYRVFLAPEVKSFEFYAQMISKMSDKPILSRPWADANCFNFADSDYLEKIKVHPIYSRFR